MEMNKTKQSDMISSYPDIVSIKSHIYTIRGQQVMLDYDLSTLYGYEVKRLNEQVKRNKARFPEDFMFQLTAEEVEAVKSQFATSPDSSFYAGQDGGRRKPPYAFTEQGIYMLAAVLKGKTAVRSAFSADLFQPLLSLQPDQ